MALSRSAVDNGDLLRLIGGNATTIPGLVTATGQRPDNLKRSLGRLGEDGLVEDGADGAPRLTEAGALAVQALDLADGKLDIAGGAQTSPWNFLAPHPDNPRKTFKREDLKQLAESIAGPDRIEHPLIVGRPDANGVRLIYDGERRWRAVDILVAAGRWPEDRPLPIEEREDTEDLIFEVSLVVNQSGEKLNKVEEARALYTLHLRHGWEAPRLSSRTGILLRTVQHALQVMKEAEPMDIAAYEADPAKYTWQMLRESVQTKKAKTALELRPEEALALAEHAMASLKEHGSEGGPVRTSEPGPGLWHALRDRQLLDNVFIGDGRRYAKLGAAPELAAWLVEIGFAADPAGVLARLRRDVVGALQATALAADEYITPWLNRPPELAEPEPLHPHQLAAVEALEAVVAKPDAVALYADLAGKTLEGATPPPTPHAPDLTEAEARIMLDLDLALRVNGKDDVRGFRVVPVFGIHTDPHANSLRMKKMIALLQAPRNGWLIYVTPIGQAWLDAADAPKTETTSGQTEWLVEPLAEAQTPASVPAADAAPAFDEAFSAPASGKLPAAHPVDAYTQEAALILAEVDGSSATTPAVLNGLLQAVRLEAPFNVDRDAKGMTLFDAQGRDLLTVDSNGDLPDDLARARAVLVARALNAAFGVGEP